jgi:transposase
MHIDFDWSSVAWTDETYIECGGSRAPRWCKTNQRPVVPSVKHPFKLMFWAAISLKTHSKLFVFLGHMTGSGYVKMLEDSFLPNSRQRFGDDLVFQQDNAPAHTSRAAKQLFHDRNITVLPWPSNSPDLNPIENIWSILKTNVAKRCPKTKSSLETIAVEEWAAIPQEFISSAISSVPKRIEQILNMNGRKCDY